MYKGVERRKYKRVYKNFTTQIRSTPPADLETIQLISDMVVIQNLGGGGALFRYNRKIKEGTPLELKINFPLSKNAIACSGKVLRIEKTTSSNLHGTAVIFTEISEEDKGMICRFTERVKPRFS